MKHFKLHIIVALLISAPLARPASTYDFLSVTTGTNNYSTGTFTSTFTSLNGNGYITATDYFPITVGTPTPTPTPPPRGYGGVENQNNAIYPSTFQILFPGSVPSSSPGVYGHLTQTLYSYQSVVTLDLTHYNLSSSTVFGIWNTTDEVVKPAGGNPVYRIQLLDASNVLQPPSSFRLIGNQDNTTQVTACHSLTLNTATGEITFGALPVPTPTPTPRCTHTDAAFFDHIPAGTKEIRIYADLPPLQNANIGDGVGYYFAELHQPSPTPTPTASPTATATAVGTVTPSPTPVCAQVTGEARCLPNGGYSYTFSVTNNSENAMSQILLTPAQGSTFTLSPQLSNLPSPLQNGQSTTVTTNISNVKPGDRVCFFVSLLAEKAPCCNVQVCLTLPQCGGASPTPRVTSSQAPTLRQQPPAVRQAPRGRRRR